MFLVDRSSKDLCAETRKVMSNVGGSDARKSVDINFGNLALFCKQDLKFLAPARATRRSR